jgi:urease accessory protein
VYTSTFGGGLVDGDAIQLAMEIGPDATALIASQAATKVYRSPGGTSVDLRARVRSGGLLIAAPDPVVCFAGARYRQTQQFELDRSAGLLVVDSFTSGRRATGERWQFDRYDGRVSVRVNGRLVLLDSLSLSRDDGSLARRMGRFETMCLVVLIGPELDAHATRIVSYVSAMRVPRRADVLVGASALQAGGCSVRIAGTSVETVTQIVREFLQFVPALLGDDPWARKW